MLSCTMRNVDIFAFPGMYSCNFESGLCNYTQVKGDVFDWSRSTGSSLSVGTGPTNDHTYGTPRGNFLKTH